MENLQKQIAECQKTQTMEPLYLFVGFKPKGKLKLDFPFCLQKCLVYKIIFNKRQDCNTMFLFSVGNRKVLRVTFQAKEKRFHPEIIRRVLLGNFFRKRRQCKTYTQVLAFRFINATFRNMQASQNMKK